MCELGELAKDMQRKEMLVLKWMKDEAGLLHLVTAGQSPHYAEYQAATKVFYDRLREVVEEEQRNGLSPT